jgi:hypothetical protein
MELKDVILSTLAEMEDATPETVQDSQTKQNQKPKNTDIKKQKEFSQESELAYLNSIRERLLVLFEGFQAPNNVNIEAKIDLTLNFLEYVLATIDSRLENLKNGSEK